MRRLALVAIACGLPVSEAGGQLAATLDAGLSAVRYDGFLTSAAITLTPTLRWEHRAGFLSARGTYLRFESGNRSVDGSLAGSWFAALGPRFRVELAGDAGASAYADVASFRHALAAARLHWLGAQRGAWLGAGAGRSSFGNGASPVVQLTGGAWTRYRAMRVLMSAEHSSVGDTVYTDVTSSARLALRSLTVDAIIGARLWSRGGGRGLYGEGSVSVPASSHLTIVLAAGRYPTDAVRGSIAGRYVTAAIRLGTARSRPTPPTAVPTNEAPALQLIMEHSESARLVIRAPGALSVEIMGDFTDWQPTKLLPTGTGLWELPTRVPRGVHRCNVRLNGGPWLVPHGTAAGPDDYDGRVGLFVVP